MSSSPSSTLPNTEDDIFNAESAPEIIDCDVLEAAKENIQPLAKGRRATALSAILATPHAQRESRLSSARQKHRINVELALEDDEDEDADPLEAYTRFINWTLENYPQGHSAESGLLELLEEATRVLRDDRGGKWKNDLRYLKLWVLYASFVEKPAIIFKFCLVNEIGTSHSLLYEEFALALEKAGRKVEADETYLLGINRKATPIERLENKHREFQKRMMSSISSSSSSDANSTVAPPTNPRRPILGTTSSSTSSSHRTTPSQDLFGNTPPPRPNARLQIFQDPSGGEAADPDTDNTSPWPELGTRKSRIKENVREVSKAVGTTLRQPGRSRRIASGSGNGGTKMMIYRDPEPEGEQEEDQEQAAEDEDEKSSMPPPPLPPSQRPMTKTRSVSSASKSSMMIFRDEEEPTPPAPRTTRSKTRSSKGSISVFVDEPAPTSGPSMSAAGSKKKHASSSSKSGLMIFRDDEADSIAPTPSSSKSKSKHAPSASSSSSKIAIFKDEGSGKSKKSPGPGSIAVFRDGDTEAAGDGHAASSSLPPVPSTPKFTPYRDEETTISPSRTPSIPSTVMREKGRTASGSGLSGLGLGIIGAGVGSGREGGGIISVEAEALRKDPLKNYREEERRSVLGY
ncbi:Mad3/BUB1 homology region 1-domain-containing protein [Abortiporus biennis]|nr:Mad3/BUB1 homology region 1-domain-containing protein [Abortiporus biennis]